MCLRSPQLLVPWSILLWFFFLGIWSNVTFVLFISPLDGQGFFRMISWTNRDKKFDICFSKSVPFEDLTDDNLIPSHLQTTYQKGLTESTIWTLKHISHWTGQVKDSYLLNMHASLVVSVRPSNSCYRSKHEGGLDDATYISICKLLLKWVIVSKLGYMKIGN